MSSRAQRSSASPDATATAGGLQLAIGRIARRMKQLLDETDLTFSETSVLTRLQLGGPSTPTALARAEHVRPQAMGSTLTALEERRLISRQADPSDGRKVIIEIAPAGASLLDSKRREVARAVEQAVAEGFSAAELRQLAQVVPLLDRLADRL